MRKLYPEILLFALVAPALVLAVPARVEAVTKVNGALTLEETYASGPAGSTNLLEGGINLSIQPQTRKNLQSRFNIPVRFVLAGEDKDFQTSPVGNFTFDLAGDWYNANLQYGRTVTVNSTAEFIDSTASRGALALFVPDLPRLSTSFSRTESTSAGLTTTVDNLSIFSDYRYKWLNFRGGYSFSQRSSVNQRPTASSSAQFGMGGSYMVLPKTTLSFDYNFSRFVSELTTGADNVTLSHAFRLAADSRPFEWLGLSGNFSKNITAFESGSTDQQFAEGTASLFPWRSLRFSASLGNRSFDDAEQSRSVTFTRVEAAFTRELLEKVNLGLNVSRSYENDPSQGDNIRDSFGLNTVMDLTSRISLRANLNVSRNENNRFISSKIYDASGTLADRDALAADPSRNLQPGFVFYDTVNSDLYTLVTPDNPATPAPDAVWSAPVHFDLATEQFSVSKNVQINMIPTDKTVMVFSYNSNASSESLDLARIGNQSLNGSITHSANRRTNYSLAGTASFPELGTATYAGSATMSYRFYRNHKLSMGYSRQISASKSSDSLSATLGLALRKRTAMDLIFSTSELFKENETYFIKFRFSKAF